MAIRYQVNPGPSLKAEEVLKLLEQAGISKPNWTVDRMSRALSGSAIVACAWDDENLIGFANAISDFAWIGYLSQLAVSLEFQNRGIGKRLVELVLAELGEEVTLLVHSRDTATGFYRSIGFEPYSNVFRIKRRR